MGRLIQLVRERKLDQVAPAYAVAAWLFVQAASIFLPAYDAPAWVMRWVIAASIVGLPFVLAVGWLLFAPDVDPEKAGRQRNWIPAGAVVAALVVLWAGMAVYWARGSVRAPAWVQRPAAAASLAVLPFENLSGQPDKIYFSDGISDELINALSRVDALHVAARTSSFALRDKNLSVQEIARRLGVRMILEGSVREVGNRVRISTRLIKASDGFPVWSNSYDRDLTDILTIQSDIAQAIAQELTHRLLPGRSDQPATINAEAYRKYLEGKFYLAQNTTESVVRATALFRQSVALQANFTEARAALGYALMNGAINDGRRDLIPEADATLAAVFAIDPDNVTALIAHSGLSITKSEWAAAIADQKRLQALKIVAAPVLHSRGLLFNKLALHRRALSAERTAVVLDPLSFASHFNISNNYAQLLNWKASEDVARQALAIVPGHPGGLELLCQALAHQGELAETKRISAKLLAGSPPVNGVQPFSACAFELALYSGDRTKARAMLDLAAKEFKPGVDSAAYLCGFFIEIGAYAEGIDWFKRALASGEQNVFEFAAEAGFPDAFYRRVDWIALTKTPLFVHWRAARSTAMKQLPENES